MAHLDLLSSSSWSYFQPICPNAYYETDIFRICPTEEHQKSTTSELGKGKMATNDMLDAKATRRAQNRESQKNFRARQAMRVQFVEAEVTRLQRLCQALEVASADKNQEIKLLNAYMEQITTEIKNLKHSRGLSVEQQAAPEKYEGFDMIFDNMAFLESSGYYPFEEGSPI